MNKDHLLLIYYHPVIYDLAESFLNIFSKVTIAVNPNLKDNYGGYKNVCEQVSKNPHLENIQCIPLSQAQVNLRKYSLVGVDGVFDGDAIIMKLCEKLKVPFFCINGYPHQHDEPSQNILSFSHYLPQVQYRKNYPYEGHVKELDWQHIAKNGKSEGKNIFVFYPEMNAAKRFYNENCGTRIGRECGFSSFIHRYEECNKYAYEVYEQIRQTFPDLENYTNKSQEEVFQIMWKSKGTLHLKHADCPGITVLESLILGVPVYTMESFVNASANQEVLIDEYNSVVASSVKDLRDRMMDTLPVNFGPNVNYVWMLTNFKRQADKLERFFEQCMK